MTNHHRNAAHGVATHSDCARSDGALYEIWCGLLISVLIVLPGLASANEDAGVWLHEINRDIWQPFMTGVASDNAELYLAVRSRDYVRIAADSRFIMNHADYVDDTLQMMARYRERGSRIAIDLRFEERIADGRHASEKGLMRVVFTAQDAEPRVHLSRFHSVSRKEGDRWRVLTDYFPAGDGVTEAQFQDAHAPEDVAPFRCYMAYPAKALICPERPSISNTKHHFDGGFPLLADAGTCVQRSLPRVDRR